MRNKQLEKRLNSYNWLKEEIVQLKLQLEEIQELREGKCMTYSDMPKGNGTSSPVEQQLEREEGIQDKIKNKEREVLRIESLLRILTEEEQQVIQARYINNNKVSTIALTFDLKMSRAKIFRLTDSAIEKMGKLLQ